MFYHPNIGNIALAFHEMEKVFESKKVDYEGMQVMRTLATNMVFLMESIALGKDKSGLPEYEDRVWTNFTR